MNSRDAVTVGIDIGTTSVKAVAVAGDGTVVERARIRHPLTIDADRLRHDARKAWRNGPRRALAAMRELRPRAVTVSGMVPSLAAVNARGVPLSDGLLYGDEAGRGGDTSIPGLTGDAPQFLRALVRDHRDARGYWPAQSTAIAALGAPASLSRGVGGVLYPLVQNGEWVAAELTAAGARADQLPMLVDEHQAVGDADGALIDGGAIDVMCERLVSGLTEPGEALVICGSTLIVMALLPPGASPAPDILAFPDPSGATSTTAASNAGALFLDWVDRTVAPAKAREGGRVSPHRVPVWTPYIRGERSPWNDPELRASLTGLHLGHDAAAIRRGAFEASAFVVRHLLELMDLAPRRVRAVGGGTRSPGWMQAIADATQAPVEVATEPEGAAIGAAYMARVTAGLETDIAGAARWARPTSRIEPADDWVAAVDVRYREFRRLVG